MFTLGPPPAEDVLREAIAWGLDRDVDTTGVLVTDPAFAGSDTLATAKALAAALRSARARSTSCSSGRNSVDADTGQVGPELAELLDLPFLTGVRHLALDATGRSTLRCEHDDGWVQAEVDLPAVLSTAERLIDPCKVEPDGPRRGARPIASGPSPPPTSAPVRGARPRARPGSGAVRVIESERAPPPHRPTRRSTSRCAGRSRSSSSAARSIPHSTTSTDLGIVPATRSRTGPYHRRARRARPARA